MKKLFLIACFVLLTLSANQRVNADTLTLVAGGPTTFGGASAGPYGGVLDGQNINMLCLSFNRVTPMNQPWTVDFHQLTATGIVGTLYGSQPGALQKYQIAAWLYDQMSIPANSGQIANLHGAAWNLFVPSTPDTAGSNAWLLAGLIFINSPAAANFDFSRFLILTPVGTGNQVQEFITTVPEPATMLLLGTGLAGLGAAARRRRKGRLGAQE